VIARLFNLSVCLSSLAGARSSAPLCSDVIFGSAFSASAALFFSSLCYFCPLFSSPFSYLLFLIFCSSASIFVRQAGQTPFFSYACCSSFLFYLHLPLRLSFKILRPSLPYRLNLFVSFCLSRAIFICLNPLLYSFLLSFISSLLDLYFSSLALLICNLLVFRHLSLLGFLPLSVFSLSAVLSP